MGMFCCFCQSQVYHTSDRCRWFRRWPGNSFTSNARSLDIPSSRSFGRKVSTVVFRYHLSYVYRSFRYSVTRRCKTAHEYEAKGGKRQSIHRYGATSRRSRHLHMHCQKQAQLHLSTVGRSARSRWVSEKQIFPDTDLFYRLHRQQSDLIFRVIRTLLVTYVHCWKITFIRIL